MDTFTSYCEKEDWDKEQNTSSAVFVTTTGLISIDSLSISEDIEDKMNNDDYFPNDNDINPIKAIKHLNNMTFSQTLYQSALVDNIVKSNSIVLLDKFEGRLFTIILVFRELCQEIFGPFYRYLPFSGLERTNFRRSVILGSSELLEHYQCTMKKYLPKNLNTRIVSRIDKRYDFEWFKKIIENTHVFIMTNNVIEEFLNTYMNISDFNIIAFDNVCYDPLQKNCYNEFIDIYQKNKYYSNTKYNPRILGLSGCAIFGIEKEPTMDLFRQQFQNLSNQLNALILTSEISSGAPRIFQGADCHYGSTSARSFCAYKNKKYPIYLFLTFMNREIIGLHYGYERKLKEYRTYIKEILQNTKNNANNSISRTEHKNEELDVVLTIVTDIDTVLRDVGYWGSYRLSVYCLKHLGNISNVLNRPYTVSAIVILSRILRNYIQQIEIHKIPAFNDISEKFCVFIRELRTQSDQVQFNSIVVVDNEILTYTITLYLQELAGKYPEYKSFKIQTLYGANSKSPLCTNNTRDHYYEIIEMFRARKINIMVIDKTVIKTIDMPICNTMIIFNGMNNFSFYKQTRIQLVENHGRYLCLTSNEEKSNIMSQIQLCVKHETLYNDIIEKDIILKGIQNTVEDLDTNKNQTDGAVSLYKAEEILESYSQSLVSTRDKDMYAVTKPIYKLKQRKQVGYSTETLDLEYNYEIFLPKSSYMIEHIRMPENWSTSKRYAKGFAAYMACKELCDRGEITECSTSKVKWVKQCENIAESIGKIRENGSQIYPLKVANCLQISIQSNRNSFYQSYFIEKTITNLKSNTSITSFAFISGSALNLHRLPTIVLNYTSKYVEKENSKIQFLEPTQIILSESEIESIHLFNSTLFRVILENLQSIEYDYNNSSKMYLIVPTRIFCNVYEGGYCYSSKIDFELLKRLKNWPFFKQNFSLEENENYYKGMIVRTNVKPNCITHKANYHQVIGSDPNTTIDSPFPDNSKVTSYREHFMIFHNVNLMKSNQISLLIKPFPNEVLNRLKSYEKNSRVLKETSKKNLEKWNEENIVFPELVSPVPLLDSLTEDYQEIPSICRRVESFLLAKEFSEKLKVKLPILTCLAALTSKRAEEVPNLERLEFLGDSILAYIVVNHLFLTFPNENQAVLSSILSNRVKNSHLLKLSLCKNINLPEYVTGREFNPKYNWSPPGFKVKCSRYNYSKSSSYLDNKNQSSTSETNLHEQDRNYSVYTHQELSDKSIADSFEALVATVFSTCGLSHTLKFLYQFDKLSVIREIDPDLIDHLSNVLLHYSDNFSGCQFNYYLQGKECLRYIYLKFYRPCYWSVETFRKYLKHFQNTHEIFATTKLKIKRKLSQENLYTLVQALTHDSYIINSFTPSYHRLMFLGEAIICYLIASCIMTNAPENYQPKDLHIIKTCVLQNNNLARICINKGIQEYLLTTNSQLHAEIHLLSISANNIDENDFFKEQLGLVSKCISGKSKIEDSVNDSQKVLADIYKSTIGSSYIINEYDLVQLWTSFGKELSHSVTKLIQIYSKYECTSKL